MQRITHKRWLAFIFIIIILMAGLSWFATSSNSRIWPIRNTLQYRLLTWWNSGPIGPPAAGLTGTLQGVVKDTQGRPIEGAWVLLAYRDGTTYTTRSDSRGAYRLDNVAPGSYRPVAGAPGYKSVDVGGFWGGVKIQAGETTQTDFILLPESPRVVTAGQDFKLGEAQTLACQHPLASSAIRQKIEFQSNGQTNQPAFYYRPITATAASQLPILLAVYPGPAASWECASLPLAAAGYAVLAAGPAYSFDLEADVDELTRILGFARQGRFPGGDGSQIALLGGSYSSLHVQRLLQRGQPAQAALLLGPPTDLFEMRRQLESGAYIPPFGLDQALIALGLPDQVPLRYWQYSGAYHARGDFPPLAVLHSRTDEVVPYQQSELLIKNLELVGAPYEAHFFDGASHYLLAEGADEDTLKIYDITLEFLAKHLQSDK
jgi:dipeptidyl aminopeptidase/acylaminoacyl peptidase